MVSKKYEWVSGASLDNHSRRKHKILREYFSNYIRVRCQLPLQSRFRLAIIDGFAGGGRYDCGSGGSPVIFLEELISAIEAINLHRASRGFGEIEIECLLVLNDDDESVIEILRENIAPLIAQIQESVANLHLRVEYLACEFETAYPIVKSFLSKGRYRNVIFNLDQCGHSSVKYQTIVDIIHSNPSTEVFYTFAIEALITFLRKSEPNILERQLSKFGIGKNEINKLEGAMSRNTWLGAAERIVFESFRNCAPYVSPFSINNPEGWRYWLIHLANSYRARQVYNNILHNNSSVQAHFGRSGLDMLHYDPGHDGGSLYLFDERARNRAKEQLLGDIPRLITDSGDVVEVADFYAGIYNMTPAHTDDIHSAIIDNPDLEVVTPTGGKRRKANTIVINDVLKRKAQTSFFPMFSRIDPKSSNE